jgi:hypothetical protein
MSSATTAAAAAPVTTAEAYTQLARRHRQQQEKRRQLAAQAMTDLQGAAEKTLLSLEQQSTDRQRATALLSRQREVEDTVRALHETTAATQQKLAQWAGLFAGFHSALKDLGDLTNWSQAVESDIRDAVTVLDAVVKAKAEAAKA